jgi:predicted membrane protein
MKLYLSTLALFLMLAFISDIRISFSPFSITFARPWLAVGIILIMCGCICLKAQWYGEGLKRGAEIKEEVKEIKKSKDERNSNTL